MKITTESIEILLLGRQIIEYYDPLIDAYPEKLSYTTDLKFELSKLNFKSRLSFLYYSDTHNLYEFDQSYIMKPIRDINTNTPIIEDFCFGGSGCENRGLPSCLVNGEFDINCFNREPLISKVMPFEKSIMANDYRQKALDFGFTDIHNLLPPHPLICIGCKEITPNTLLPRHCLGTMIKITEPRFDTFWKMEKYIKWANLQDAIRESMINV